MASSMKPYIPRIRMFAGPNGSGKSTIKSVVNKELLGVYINPDEIEAEMKQRDYLDLLACGVQTDREEILEFFQRSSLLEQNDLLDEAATLRFGDGKLIIDEMKIDS